LESLPFEELILLEEVFLIFHTVFWACEKYLLSHQMSDAAFGLVQVHGSERQCVSILSTALEGEYLMYISQATLPQVRVRVVFSF